MPLLNGLAVLVTIALVSGPGVSARCAAPPSPPDADAQYAVPLIGVDAHGRAVQVLQSRAAYMQCLQELALSVRDTAVAALGAHQRKSAWQLSAVTVGISVSATVGMGPFKIGASPSCSFVIAPQL